MTIAHRVEYYRVQCRAQRGWQKTRTKQNSLHVRASGLMTIAHKSLILSLTVAFKRNKTNPLFVALEKSPKSSSYHVHVSGWALGCVHSFCHLCVQRVVVVPPRRHCCCRNHR